MNDLRREILSQVASGTISAEQGAARLTALESEPAPAATPAAPVTAVKLIRIVARFGNTEVIGDPSVAFAVAEGPHGVRQDGDTMVIDQSPMSDETIFTFSRPRIRMSIPGFETDRKLIVRMNPSIALTASVQAGNLSIEGVQGAVKGDIKAGNCHISEFRGPIDLNVIAGNITASGRLDGGASAIRCKMGEVRVALARTSSVRINAHTTMGDVAIEGDGVKDRIVGAGAGTLDIDCLMGNVRVEVA
jgi:Putative adhesin